MSTGSVLAATPLVVMVTSPYLSKTYSTANRLALTPVLAPSVAVKDPALFMYGTQYDKKYTYYTKAL